MNIRIYQRDKALRERLNETTQNYRRTKLENERAEEITFESQAELTKSRNTPDYQRQKGTIQRAEREQQRKEWRRYKRCRIRSRQTPDRDT